MPVTHIKIPDKCLKDSKFTKSQQLSVIKSMLTFINLPVFRARKFKLNIRKFGVISSHGNTKSSKKKYQDKYNRRVYKARKLKKEFSEKKLLF